MSELVILGLGSNMGDAKLNIEKAYAFLSHEVGEILLKSSLYQSPPWGFEADQDFINSVVQIETDLEPLELLAIIKSIEKKMGRLAKTSANYESRIIDIDILDYSKRCIDEVDLSIPHPLIEERAFVLLPLLEILPNWRHPKTGVSIPSLLSDISDLQNILLLK